MEMRLRLAANKTVMTDIIQHEAVTPEVESQLIGRIKARMEGIPSTSEILPGRSKVLRLGWDYDHPTQWISEIPWWLSDALFPLMYPFVPNNITINLLKPGKGVAAHVDSPQFDDPIFIFSLNSGASMIFRKSGQKPIKLFLPPRSLLRMAGSLRIGWTHEIPSERTDTDGLGVRHDRKTRWSVVLRKRL